MPQSMHHSATQQSLGELEQRILKCLKLSLGPRPLAVVAQKIGESLEATWQHANELHKKELLDYEADSSKVKLSTKAWRMLQSSEK